MTRLALVTGTSRGLGEALAQQLRAQGWRVRGLSRTEVHPDDVPVDLTRPAAIAPAVGAALSGCEPERLTELLVVHNAATVEPVGALAGVSADAVADAVHLNLTAGMLLFAAVAAACQALPIRKVLGQISSGAAERPHPGLSVYCATKAGMEHHLRVLACEQAAQAHPFIVVSVDPGALDTGMQSTLRGADPKRGLAVDAFVQRLRDGRLADPHAIVHAVVDRLLDRHLVSGIHHRVLAAVTAR